MLFDLNEKKVKVGKSKNEGWARKVLKQAWCQLKQHPVIRPGKVAPIRLNIEMEMKFVSLFSDERYLIRSMVLLNRVKRQARNMRKKRVVRKPFR